MAQDNPYLIEENNPYLNLSTESVKEPVKPTPQQIERMSAGSVTPPITGGGGAAFGMYPRQRAETLTKVQAAAEEERKAPKFSWQDMTTNEDLQKIQRDFLKVRGGVDTTKLTNEEVAKQFMSNLRADEFNTFSLIGSINALKNANMDDKLKMEYGKQLYEQVASATEKEGQPGLRPYADIAKAVFTDLTNYVSLGVAGLGRQALKPAAQKTIAKFLGTEATETAAKTKLTDLLSKKTAQALTPTAGKVAGATVGAEMVVGAGQDVMAQKEEQARAVARGEEPKPIDYERTAAMSLLSGVMGYGEARGIRALPQGKSGSEKLNEILQSKKITSKDPNAPPTPAERVIIDDVTQNMDSIVEEFMNIQGGRILDDINPATPLTDAKIQKELSSRAVRVALNIMETDPSFRVKPGQKTSTAIAEVFSNLDNIDDAVLEQAIRKEGLTPEEFAQANKLTVTEAAQVMQQYSAAAKAMKRLSQIDPEFAKQAEALFGIPNEFADKMSVLSRLERESKAIIVSGVDTTVRNVLGTTTGLAFNSAASLVEGTLYTLANTLTAGLNPANAGRRLSAAGGTLKKGVGDTIKDAFSVYGYLMRSGLDTAVTDQILSHNPALRNTLLSATQESSTQELSKVARLANTLNVAQDAFFRKAIFTAEVEKNLRKIGLDLYEVMAEGKTIPASILKDATDKTLKATFSYTPKMPKGGLTLSEKGAEGLGNLFVKAAEFPGGSLLATFPRFMTNAIAFQYKYAPTGVASGIIDVAKGAKMLSNGDETGAALIRQGQETYAKGVVGTAAIAAAYKYRLENQDTDTFSIKNEDGTTTDVRPLFPAGFYLALGDFMAKRKLGLQPKVDELVETAIGMKLPAGTQNTFLNQLIAATSSEKEADKLEVAFGKVIGDFFGRFAQPFIAKDVYRFFDQFREEGTIQRDPNVITSEDTVDRITEAATNRLKSKLPVFKEELPEAIPRLREGPVYREGEFFYGLVGLRDVPNKTPEEKEIERLGLEPYRLYGPSSGDKEYDREFVKAANPSVIRAIKDTVNRKDYQERPLLEQQRQMSKAIAKSLDTPKTIVESKLTAENFDKALKMRFNKLPADERAIINKRYAADNEEGLTLEEAKDYRALDKYYYKYIVPLEFAAGGLVAQTNQLLSKRR